MTDRTEPPSLATIVTIVASLIIVMVVTWWFLWLWSDDGSVTVWEGDRVCVAMMGEDDRPIPDAYYCGPLVFTEHDDLYTGEPR